MPTANQTGISFMLKDLQFAQQLHDGASNVLPEIASIIRKHGLEDDVVIRLLHTHFPLGGDEALVHRWRGDAIETQVGAVPEGGVACTVTPSQSGARQLDVIEYIEPGHATDAARQRAERVFGCRAFVEEASAALAKNGMNTLYGLGLRFYADAFDLTGEMILVEQNDFVAQRSETRAVNRSVLDSEIWTETSWRVAGDRLAVESGCITSGAMPCQAPPPPPPA